MSTQKQRRKQIRLQHWNYASNGYYFVTICTHKRFPVFSQQNLKEIAEITIINIPTHPHAKHVSIDKFIVMPDHIHLIIVIENASEKQYTTKTVIGTPSKSVGSIISHFKRLATTRIKAMRKSQSTHAPIWQRGFYERIIRNEKELNAVRRYIEENPQRHAGRKKRLDRLLAKMDYTK